MEVEAKSGFWSCLAMVLLFFLVYYWTDKYNSRRPCALAKTLPHNRRQIAVLKFYQIKPGHAEPDAIRVRQIRQRICR